MVKITKQEAFYMRDIVGNEYIKKTYSKHPTYYLVEDKTTMKKLREYREARTVK